MEQFDTPEQARLWCNNIRQHHSIGFVPTMGALHDGHLALVKQAQQQNDRVCVSIFVNPLQFDNKEDFAKYPSHLEDDVDQLLQIGCDMVFTGQTDDFFPDPKNIAQIPEDLIYCRGLEGNYRQGHFAGVWAIVDRLFRIVGDANAYFGEKDYQQYLVVRALAAQLSRHGPKINVIPCTTIREPSGLAMSSRNRRLSQAQKQRAQLIYQCLLQIQKLWQQGQHNATILESEMRQFLDKHEFTIDYAAVRDPIQWTENTPTHALKQARAFIAIHLDQIRLIDNIALTHAHD